MNNLKSIRDDLEKSTLISKKVLGKIVELIGENTYQFLKKVYSDITITAGEVAINLDSLEYLVKENEQLKQQTEKMKCCMNCKGYDTTSDGAVTCNKFRFFDCKSNITLNNENCTDYWELAE